MPRACPLQPHLVRASQCKRARCYRRTCDVGFSSVNMAIAHAHRVLLSARVVLGQPQRISCSAHTRSTACLCTHWTVQTTTGLFSSRHHLDRVHTS